MKTYYLQIISLQIIIISLPINSINSNKETGLKLTPGPNTGLREGLESNTHVPSQINVDPYHQHHQQEKKGKNTGKTQFFQFDLDALHNTQRIVSPPVLHTVLNPQYLSTYMYVLKLVQAYHTYNIIHAYALSQPIPMLVQVNH